MSTASVPVGPAAQPLFRAQALAARYQILEQPLGLRAPGLHRAALALLLSSLAGASLLLPQPYSEKVTVQGFAGGAGHVRVRTQAGAVVTRVAVVEDQWVEAGAVLLELKSDQVAPQGESRGVAEQRALDQETQALAQQRKLLEAHHWQRQSSLQSRLQASRARGDLLRQALKLAREQQELVRSGARRYADLAAAGAVAVNEVQLQQRQVLASNKQLLTAQRDLAIHEQDLAQQRAELQEARRQHQQALAQWAADQARLQQRQAAHSVASARLLTAPAAGFVSALSIQVGTRLRSNQHVLSLLRQPARNTSVVLLVPSRARGGVAKGQSVRLRYAGYPFEKYGMPVGRIDHISRAPVRGAELDYPLAVNSWVYLARVMVPEQSMPALEPWIFEPAQVAPGMELEADILVRSAPLWQRLAAPLSRLWQRTAQWRV